LELAPPQRGEGEQEQWRREHDDDDDDHWTRMEVTSPVALASCRECGASESGVHTRCSGAH
jgi:hypothetical protein